MIIDSFDLREISNEIRELWAAYTNAAQQTDAAIGHLQHIRRQEHTAWIRLADAIGRADHEGGISEEGS